MGVPAICRPSLLNFLQELLRLEVGGRVFVLESATGLLALKRSEMTAAALNRFPVPSSTFFFCHSGAHMRDPFLLLGNRGTESVRYPVERVVER
jgi:hypothetical protein